MDCFIEGTPIAEIWVKCGLPRSRTTLFASLSGKKDY
jgi:hypothetical protein